MERPSISATAPSSKQKSSQHCTRQLRVDPKSHAEVVANEGERERPFLAEIITSYQDQGRPPVDNYGKEGKNNRHPSFAAKSPEWQYSKDTHGSCLIAVLRSLTELVAANIMCSKTVELSNTREENAVGLNAAAGMETKVMGFLPTMTERGTSEDGNDRDNQRKGILDNALKLLRELVDNEVKGNRGKLAKHDIGGECKDFVWDVIVAVLSDRWSDIRRMGADHARHLVAALGACEAKTLYKRCAAECGFILYGSEPQERRSWKRVHGFLLGMHSAIEGARTAFGSSKEVFDRSEVGEEDFLAPVDQGTITEMIPSGSSVPSSKEKRQGQQRSADLADGFEVLALETSGRDTAAWDGRENVAETSNAVGHPCKEGRCGLETIRLHAQKGLRGAHGMIETSSLPSPPSSCSPLKLPPPPLHLPPRPLWTSYFHRSPLTVTFTCLAHCQAVVREAAIEVMCSLARLRPRTAFAMYEKAIDGLERWKGCNAKANGRTAARAEKDWLGHDVKLSSRPVNAGEKIDRPRGLLCLLERLVQFLPLPAVRATFVRVFPVLRFYASHSETALRQAASAVLLRIAMATGPSWDIGHVRNCDHYGLSPATQNQEIQDESCEYESTRVVLWTLVCNWGEQAGICMKSPPTTTPRGEIKANTPSGFEYGPVASKSGYVPGGDGLSSLDGGNFVSWEFHESVLMVYEGVLKSLVKYAQSELFSDEWDCSDGSDYSRGDFNGSPFTKVTADGTDTEETLVNENPITSFLGWSTETIKATPSMKELIIYLHSQAEGALFQAEMLLQNRNKRNGRKNKNIEVPEILPVSPAGALELWRAGTQLLPSLARAMMWWNPGALRRACERSAQVDAEWCRRGKVPYLQLRQRTRLRVASELIRAAVRYARHLAESCVDTTTEVERLNVTDGLDHIQSFRAIPSEITLTAVTTTRTEQYISGSGFTRAAHDTQSNSCANESSTGNLSIVVMGRERWGNNFDGIIDSSGSGVPLWSSLVPSRTRVGRVACAVPSSEGIDRSMVYESLVDSRGVVAQMIKNALQLCTDIPLLLTRALSLISEGPATSRRQYGSEIDGGDAGGHVPQDPGDTAEDASPVAIDPPPHYQFVFTGVVEALVLTRAFHATTGLVDSSKKAVYNSSRSTNVHNQAASPSPLPAHKKLAGKGNVISGFCLKRVIETDRYLETVGMYDAVSVVIEHQLEELHKQAFPTCSTQDQTYLVEMQSSSNGCDACVSVASSDMSCGGNKACRNRSPHFGRVRGKDDPEGKRRHRSSLINREGSGEGSLSAMTEFAIPFCWGSLALIQDSPVPGKAKRLDRMLSARIVHALPGYLSELPPGMGIRLISTMLRWLKARDEDVRWISTTPFAARTSLLVSIDIALRRKRRSTSRSPARGSPLQWLPSPTPSSNTSVSYSGNTATDGVTESNLYDLDRTRKKQQRNLTTVAAWSVVQALAGMISDSRIGKDLFPLACAVCRDAINLLEEFKGYSSPSVTKHDGSTGSINLLVKERAFISSLLCAIADHLLRCYSEKMYIVSDNDHQTKARHCTTSPPESLEREGIVATDPYGSTHRHGEQLTDNRDDNIDDCCNLSKWDDWDDGDREDLDCCNTTANKENGPEISTKVEMSIQDSYLEASRSAATVMLATVAYSAKASTCSRTTHQEKIITDSSVTTSTTSMFNVSSPESEENVEVDDGSVLNLHRPQERRTILVGTGLDASIHEVINDQSRKTQADIASVDEPCGRSTNVTKLAAAAEGSRSSTRSGDGIDCIATSLQCILDSELSDRRRQALTCAWKSVIEG